MAAYLYHGNKKHASSETQNHENTEMVTFQKFKNSAVSCCGSNC